MRLLVFELRGSIGHFRRPDTLATQATYPFITRTALLGLVGSVVGLEEFRGESWVGIELLSPVRTRVQQMSMLGKGFLGDGGSDFNRPTSIELVVNPHYRIYYSGDYLDVLAERIRARWSHYPTYLGSAFALTVPRFGDLVEGEVVEALPEGIVSTRSVVPVHFVSGIELAEGQQLARCGGMLYEHLGNRRFRGTVNLLYENSGRPVLFRPNPGALDPPVRLLRLPSEEYVCLW